MAKQGYTGGAEEKVGVSLVLEKLAKDRREGASSQNLLKMARDLCPRIVRDAIDYCHEVGEEGGSLDPWESACFPKNQTAREKKVVNTYYSPDRRVPMPAGNESSDKTALFEFVYGILGELSTKVKTTGELTRS